MVERRKYCCQLPRKLLDKLILNLKSQKLLDASYFDIHHVFVQGRQIYPGSGTRIFLRVEYSGFSDPGPAPAFLVLNFLHQRDIIFSMVLVYGDIRYKEYRIVKDVSFLINLDVLLL